MPEKFRESSLWAIPDQMLASAGNFATTLVLSRYLTPAEFGVYALVNSIVLVANGFHANLIVSPLMVLGGSERENGRRAYPGAALQLCSLLLPFWLAGLALSSAYLHCMVTGWYAFLAVVAWQYQETVRRSLFSVGSHHSALWGDLVSYPGQALAIWALMRTGHVSLNAAFGAMAVTSLLAAVLQGRQSRLRLTGRKECFVIGRDFWRIAKWLLLSSIAGFASAPLLPWLLNWARGRSEVGAFQAVYGVMNLCNPLVLSIPAIVIPAVAARKRQGGSTVWRYTLLFESVMAPLLMAMLIWPRVVLAAMYGSGSPYCAEALALRIGTVACVLAVPLSVIQCVFTGEEKMRNNAAVQTLGSLVSVLLAPLLISQWGVTGTILAETVNRAMKTTLGAVFLGWGHDREREEESGWAGLQPS